VPRRPGETHSVNVLLFSSGRRRVDEGIDGLFLLLLLLSGIQRQMVSKKGRVMMRGKTEVGPTDGRTDGTQTDRTTDQ
jgi:hypothetical protein